MGGQVGPAIESYLDTNLVIYLHTGATERISARAKQQIEDGALLISAMVMLELEMLCEIGRLKYDAGRIFADLSQQIGLSLCPIPMTAVIHVALGIKWTRDPFDRIILANAIANNKAPLITSDRRIRERYENAIW
jgi:PIN domain nuclease of toxin-antitoxin system